MERMKSKRKPPRFSWRTFVFGPLYPLIRGDLGTAGMLALLDLFMLPLVLATRWSGAFGWPLLHFVFAWNTIPAPAPRKRKLRKARADDPIPQLSIEPGKASLLSRELLQTYLDETPRSEWQRIRLAGARTDSRAKATVLAIAQAKPGYTRLCGFLPGSGNGVVYDEVGDGATVTIRLGNRTGWTFTSKGETYLETICFTVQVPPESTISISVKGGTCRIRNLQMVLIH